MLEQVAAAFERQDYRTAAELLKEMLHKSPQDPWVQFYLGRLHEVSGKLEAAEDIYRQLLRSAINSKIVAQARQGLQRLEALAKLAEGIATEQRQQAIAQATADPSNTQMGVLVLEPVPTEIKTTAAQKFAQIMQLDPYTARLQLPSRGWRLCRTGQIGELRFLGQNLRKSGVPCFWATLAEIQRIQVFQVNYFQSAVPPATVVCQNEQGQLGSLSFNWSEVTQRVTGLLPIFEQVVDLDARGKLKRKTQTQDYAQFCDLHLPSKLCILRLHDKSYQFQHDVAISKQQSQINSQMTTRINWNNLTGCLDQQLTHAKSWSDFTPFAETVLEQTEMLGRLQSHIHLFRRTETNWDPAFHLYSGLVFVKNQAGCC
ncbi:tetratricopeptide repeat protein [Chroococcidiopsis sp. CCMEE 29]|uniref:tetratricopeptide repeat protein n=1 Tax=Chroococcidiopsis sp. CCMEE 29 TaxID=155894 RepID=UPI00202154DF|nr:tetratricopeptide repeat protein [Chroococcidiopsis sp. CCMEE 29]